MTRPALPRFTLGLAALSLAACASAAAGPTPRSVAPPAPVDPIVTQRVVDDHLASMRQLQIRRLRDYAASGVFPKNRVRAGMANIFVDEDGVLCAAANLIALSGSRALVDQTAATNNLIRLADVQAGPLMDWMLTSGLTQHEIDRIQEPYFEYEPEPEPQIAEVERLKAHFAVVLAELESDTATSLSAASARLLARPDLVASIDTGR